MKKAAIGLAAMLIASAVAAEEYVYIYVSYKGADGASSRHKLECTDASCKAEIKGEVRPMSLSDAQRGELIEALQTETRQFTLEGDSASGDNTMKLKVKYETPQRRMSAERRLGADNPDAVTPEMRNVLKAYLDLEIKKPELPAPGEGNQELAAPEPKT